MESTTPRRGGVLAALLVAFAVVVIVVATGGDDRHRLEVRVPDATNVIAGQEIRQGGVVVGEVGSIESVDAGRAARVELRFEDDGWPLTDRSVLRLRWGGTITYANRYLSLERPGGGRPLPDGGTLPADRFKVPVEFDQLLTTFDSALREDLSRMFDRAGAAFALSEEPLQEALREDRAPAAVREAGAVFSELNASSRVLRSLARSGDRVTAAVREANPTIGDLVSHASTTFDALAAEADGVRATLEEVPGTLTTARTTLGRAETTLGKTGELTRELAPGVSELRKVTDPLAQVLRTVDRVAPEATTTLATLREAAPDLDELVSRATVAMPRLAKIGAEGEEAARCIRPYSPEIAGFFSTWNSFTANTDKRNKYVRLQLQAHPFPNATPMTSAQVVEALPSLEYAFPRVPGWDGGQPWFHEECGAGPDALDPTKDPLARTFDPLAKSLLEENQPPQMSTAEPEEKP